MPMTNNRIFYCLIKYKKTIDKKYLKLYFNFMNLKRISAYICIIIFSVLMFLGLSMLSYHKDIKMYEKYAVECMQNTENKYPNSYICPKDKDNCKNTEERLNPNSCFCAMYNLLAPSLLVYKAKANHKDLTFIRMSYTDSYIVPTIALEKADVFFGYGIWQDSNFENIASKLYQKVTYAYDCGVEKINIETPLVIFKSECIGTDKFILDEQNSSGKVHSFGQKLKQLNLKDKKVFIKMDIAGAETEVIPDLVKYADNITGITISVRTDNFKKIKLLLEQLPMIEKDFVLVYRNLLIAECETNYKCKYMDSTFSNAINLSYINKNLIDEKYLPFKQDFSNPNDYISPVRVKTFLPSYTINWRVVLYEKLKHFLKEINKKKAKVDK